MLSAGIIGLPNAGKSTLFNSLSASHHAVVADYPFSTVDPNVGIVSVPDERLDKLLELMMPPKAVKASIEITDIAGLVKGASKGEGLGNRFLSHIREADVLIHIVKCFGGILDPKTGIEIIETELILKDMETVEKQIDKIQKLLKTGEAKLKEEYNFYSGLREHLGSGKQVKNFTLHPEGKMQDFLTSKHVLFAANVDDKSLSGNQYSEIVTKTAAEENEKAIVLCAEVESELTRLDARERTEFMEVLGMKESGLDKLLRSVYNLLGLITFYTYNEKEVRAWAVPYGTKAPQAAGVIHSDFEWGFIKAEVMKYEDILRLGSHHALKEHGLIHIEGKDYEVKDGDIIFFRFAKT